MKAILQDDGTLLVPVGECAAAEQVRADDPRYAELVADSVRAAELRGTPEEDATLAARWERNHQARRPRSA
jgi:hypothetical protein